LKLADIESEYRGAVLGDRRRSERLGRIAVELARNPGLSFPEAMGSKGQLRALAALGGHLRSNGPPGWIVLGRAYDKLLVLEQGWAASQAAGDPIDD
jgi:hypothetical protein